MLGIERGKGGNIAVWLILGVLALAFGLTFGLPSDQLSFGESGLVKVHGENVTREDFFYQSRAIARALGMDELPDGKEGQMLGAREEVLESVIERLVLVDTAEELGMAMEKQDAELWTRDGVFWGLDQFQIMPWATAENFDYSAFKAIIGQYAVAEARYLEIQRQELLAQQVRDLIRGAVTVPEAEVWAKYEKDNDQLSLRYVRFEQPAYAEIVDPSDAEIDAYIETNADALQEAWEINQARFLKLPAQVDLRLIEFAKPVAPPEGAPEEMLAEHAAKLEAARQVAVSARERIVSGGESFAAVARELSRHTDTARSGGRFGWVGVNVGSGLEPIIDETAKTLEDGQVSEILAGEEGLYLIMVAGQREGDVPEEVAKRELAADAVRDARGRELARQAAEEALLALQEGTSLDKLFAAATPALGEVGPDENIEDYALDGAAKPNDVAPEHEVEETGLFNRAKPIPGLGSNPALVEAAWSSSDEEPILDQVFEVPGGFLIAVVEERSTATEEGYADERQTYYAQLVRQRAYGILLEFAKRQCFAAKAKVELRVNEAQVDRMLNYGVETPTDEAGVPLIPPYIVCERVGSGLGMLQMQMLQQKMRQQGGRP